MTPESFAAALGDPAVPGGVIDFASSLADDERSAFPQRAIDAIDELGLARSYVPLEDGGDLGDVLAPMRMIRAIAGRDLTAAVAHGKTFLGSVSTWVAGDEAVRRRVADTVLAGQPVSWGLTERGRGSDLGATATTARFGPRGIVLDGEKWPINNATRGRAMTVLARVDERSGPRAHTLLYVDKAQLPANRFAPLPKVATHGIRGADISGLGFEAAPVSTDAVIGAPGEGLEIVLKSLQLTRPLCTALSLGAADLGLRVVGGFVLERRMFGRDLATLPAARAALVAAASDALSAEAVAIVGARHVHHRIDEMALVSSLVKFFVPDTVDLLLRDLSQLLGARSQLTELAPGNVFQKVLRDHRIVAIFDGNSVVNLGVIVGEFPSMLREGEAADARARAALGTSATLTEPVPIDFGSLRLFSRRGSALLRALPELLDAAAARIPDPDFGRDCAALLREFTQTMAEVRTFKRAPFPPPEHYLAAERVATLFAAASVLTLTENGGGFGPDALTARLVIARLAQRLGLSDPGDALVAEGFEAVAERLGAGGDASVFDAARSEAPAFEAAT
ncbi:acyl-CoA dehydrogenase family protein [Microbacteriaceae bacterium VKM Ac-2854]|nr:acyl-CoA dehydrogenase family protein [Microbacteriaceae bacterium VKM Ac-2854]